MAQDGGTRGVAFHDEMGHCIEKSGLDYGMQLYVSERDENDQREDSSKKSCSSSFARES